MKTINYIKLCLLMISITAVSCRKDMLGSKPDKSLVIPTSLADMQALLNNTNVFTRNAASSSEIGAGDYFIDANTWQSLADITERNAYIWKSDIYEGFESPDWTSGYEQVFYANVVLEGLEEQAQPLSKQAEEIRGAALFFRALVFSELAVLFAPAYDVQQAENLLGIPLRLTADIHAITPRANLEDTYEKIVVDLRESIDLLPELAMNKTLPNKVVSKALLARILLYMGNYTEAATYALSCLSSQHQLIDYSRLDESRAYPFLQFNQEVLLHRSMINYTGYRRPLGKIDTTLYYSYDTSDQRKALYFVENPDGSHSFRGNYTGTLALFGGIAWDEVYLIAAEALARTGQLEESVAYLNELLQTRYLPNTFIPFQPMEQRVLLKLVLEERRKTLLMRGQRWADLKRLNLDTELAVTLERDLDGETHTLPPGDPRYQWPIPDQVINLTGIEQNPR